MKVLSEHTARYTIPGRDGYPDLHVELELVEYDCMDEERWECSWVSIGEEAAHDHLCPACTYGETSAEATRAMLTSLGKDINDHITETEAARDHAERQRERRA